MPQNNLIPKEILAIAADLVSKLKSDSADWIGSAETVADAVETIAKRLYTLNQGEY